MALEGGEGSASRPTCSLPRERPSTHCPRAGLDRCGKSRPHWDSIPGPPSPQPVAIPTTIPGPLTQVRLHVKQELQEQPALSVNQPDIQLCNPYYYKLGRSTERLQTCLWVWQAVKKLVVHHKLDNCSFTDVRDKVKSPSFPLPQAGIVK